MGAVFALFAGFYFWTPKIIGLTYNEFLGKIHFWTMFCGVNLTAKIKFILFYIVINTLSPLACLVLSKPISVGDITDAAALRRELIDIDLNDIDNKTLDLKLNSLPSPKLPDSNDPKNKHILAKLENIQAENKFIGIKDSKTEILLNIENKAGVYMFFNLVNGKTYIGSSVKLDRRFRVHISSIGFIKLPLYNALNKYGLNNFAFLILQ